MDAISKIQEFERFGSILGLERMTVLMEKLGNPQDELRYVHVAGTNGKGSVCRYVYEALRENGYRAGLYTSPFLEIFNERIEFDGKYISDEDLAAATDKVLECVEEMVAEGHDSPTEFEVTTAVAFLYFRDKNADCVVLEVGLGGRGDSTNIVKQPLVSVITSISFDHTDRLGGTLAEIAGEKAGIIKAGTPVVMNVEDAEAKKVIARKAYEMGCVLYDVSKVKHWNELGTLTTTSFDTVILGTDYSGVEISMAGAHQVQNAMTALTALEIMRKKEEIRVERSRLYAGLKKAKQIGRFEIMEEEPYVILDGAHNEAGAEALLAAVKGLLPDARILTVCGMLRDKDVERITDKLADIGSDFAVTEPSSPRRLERDALAEIFRRKGRNVVLSDTPQRCCEYANTHKREYDAVIFAGSLYLIGEIRGAIKKWNS